MKTLILALTLLTAVTPVTRGAAVFVLPNAARATNLTLVGGSATGFTNTGGIYTNPTITGGTFTGGTFSLSTNTGVTASRAVVSDSAQRITNSVTTATELGYVSGVTSAIQTQLGTKAPTASPTFTGVVTTTNITSSGTNALYFHVNGSNRMSLISAGHVEMAGALSVGPVNGVAMLSVAANGGQSAYFAGQVGILTTNPTVPLSVWSDGNSMSLGTGSNVSASFVVAGSRAFFGYDATHARVQGGATKGVTLAVNGSFGSGTVALHATSAGLVGIATSVPTYDFDVNGVIQSRGSSGGVRQYTGSATNQNRMVGVVKTITTTVANVGLTETNLMTETFPASGLAATGDTVEILMFGTTAANANSKTVAAYFGAQKIVESAAFTSSAAAWRIVGTITRTGAATQVACVTVFVDGATPVTTYTAPTETLSGTITIKATGTAPTANGDITQVFHRSEFKPGNP